MKFDFIRKYLGIILFLSGIILSLFIYKDYGLSWDEEQMHTQGTFVYNRYFNNLNQTEKNSDKLGSMSFFGFEAPLIIIEKAFGFKDSRSIYLMRHLVSHIFFLFCCFMAFILIDYLYKNKLLSTIGFLLLVLNPRIYAHSFFNSRDIPFMGFFFICFLLTAIAFKKEEIKYYIMLGISCAILINIRIMGIIFVAFIISFLVIDFIKSLLQKNKQDYLSLFPKLLAFGVTIIIVLYISWPYMWKYPLGHLKDLFIILAKFPWNQPVLYLGNLIPGSDLPWHYDLVWFLISNPIIYLLLGIIGISVFIYNFLKKPSLFIFDNFERNQLLYFACFIIPFLIDILLHSVKYDDWRHLYYLYAPFVLLIIYGINKLFKTRVKNITIIIIFLGFVTTAYFMIFNHPFQNIYFNKLVRYERSEYLRRNFDLDYWGTSYKQAYEYILKNDTSKKVNINFPNLSAGRCNKMILKESDRKRINFVDNVKDAKYFVTEYRFHPQDYHYLPSQNFYTIKVLNSSIMKVYKLK